MHSGAGADPVDLAQGHEEGAAGPKADHLGGHRRPVAAVADVADLADLDTAFGAMRAGAKLGYAEFSRADVAFHETIARISRNPLLVVSEETGRISLGVGGRLEPVPRENLSRRLAALLSGPAMTDQSPARAA